VEIVQRASGRGQWDDFRHVQRYTLLASGELEVENTVTIGNGLTDIPRVGVTMTLVPGLEKPGVVRPRAVGKLRGSQAAAMIGRYTSIVADQYVPYVMPQEHGHKTDVRWLALTNLAGAGLRVEGAPTSSSRPATSPPQTSTRRGTPVT